MLFVDHCDTTIRNESFGRKCAISMNTKKKLKKKKIKKKKYENIRYKCKRNKLIKKNKV